MVFAEAEGAAAWEYADTALNKNRQAVDILNSITQTYDINPDFPKGFFFLGMVVRTLRSVEFSPVQRRLSLR